MWKKFFYVVFLCLAVFVCCKQAEANVNITIKIRDVESGVFIPYAKVKVYNLNSVIFNGTANSSGEVRKTNVASARFYCKISKLPDYLEVTRTIAVEGGPVEQTFILMMRSVNRVITIITVRDSNTSAPIAGASVQIYNNEQAVYPTPLTTDSNGIVQFDLPRALFAYRITKAGYNDATGGFTAGAGSNPAEPFIVEMSAPVPPEPPPSSEECCP